MKEFKINEYITLKLENDKTVIYIENSPFLACKRLVIHVPFEKIRDFDKIDSIDDAVEINERTILNRKMFRLHSPIPIRSDINITPEEEFWGHCSNLQVWAENGYDTRILHSNLAFPLLRKLKEMGDPLARTRYKDELAQRILNGNLNLILYLLLDYFIKDLTREELEFFFLKSNNDLKNEILKEISKSDKGNGDELMSNIEKNKGYQLLNRLAELGDTEAIEILKDNIINRMKTGSVWVICAFINMDSQNGILNVIDDNNLESIVSHIVQKYDRDTQKIFHDLEKIALTNYNKLTNKSLLIKEEIEIICRIEDKIGSVDFLASGFSDYSNKRKLLFFFINIIVVLSSFKE